uniref:Trypsin-like salivary secreted protein n=1 Tax=Aedes aegypti TaxID=7159 RepID=Q1HRU2_AEDAE|nr:trypsin-like salivary secreted protein [Aedes aegypti]
MRNHPHLFFFVTAVVSYVAAEFQNPYPPVAALFGPRNKFICNAVVLGKGQILTSADCLYLKKNGSYSLGAPSDFHVALETHSIERFHSGKAFSGKSSRWRYLQKLSRKFGAKYDNKYANEVFSNQLKPDEISYLSKALRTSGLNSKIGRNYVPVLSFRIHPGFKKSFSNDLAVLNISDRYPTDNSSIAEVSQNSIEMAFNRVVHVYGFGILSHGANETNRPVYFKVRTVEMNLLPPSRCQHDMENLFQSDQHLCLKPSGNETLCLGFTGAPIVLDGKLIGIVDFGHFSCSLDSPVVGIRLDSFGDFLGLPAPTFFDSFRKLIETLMGVKL